MKKSDPTPPPSSSSSYCSSSSSSSSSKPSSVLHHLTPNLTDHYTLGEEIGRGSNGTTYICIDKSNSKRYACKSILKSTLSSKKYFDHVLREIEIMHHVSDLPNVVRIKEAYEDSESVHLVMELCEGGELFNRIMDKGPFTEKKAASLIKTIVEVMEGFHSLGVIHRDLKPENFLFVSDDEDAALTAIDFGWSGFYEPGDILCDVVGTIQYVAPEVLDERYGPEADIWSAGVILYVLLCREYPFSADDELATAKQIKDGHLDLESGHWLSISDNAKDLIRNMLNVDPEKRFTPHQVLCHEWIVDATGDAPKKPLESAVLSRLKGFSSMNKLKKMALRVIVEWMSEEELAGLKKFFKMFDTDNSGTITYDKLKQGLRKLGSDLIDSEIQALMDAADLDNNGTIDCNEFLAATLHLNKLDKEENLKKVFSFFDIDGNGYITVDDILQVCRGFGLGDVNPEERPNKLTKTLK
ncbi:calcium-dependent protein kinase 28-like [Asparagus officinalis]|uniref:calcium-dependent protein kinase 28-like n=1 Tax=Asparagus officinalis TaxID=4686 RepID=UPI00098E0C0C|nr:calcium-dependent protein kinase 28-like [Asparagus officinalis]